MIFFQRDLVVRHEKESYYLSDEIIIFLTKLYRVCDEKIVLSPIQLYVTLESHLGYTARWAGGGRERLLLLLYLLLRRLLL